MVMTSPVAMTRAPPTATPLMLTRLSDAASNNQRPATARRLAGAGPSGTASSWSERIAPDAESNTTRVAVTRLVLRAAQDDRRVE